jgi:hypothetical protein
LRKIRDSIAKFLLTLCAPELNASEGCTAVIEVDVRVVESWHNPALLQIDELRSRILQRQYFRGRAGANDTLT